jgi:hypothetical protein
MSLLCIVFAIATAFTPQALQTPTPTPTPSPLSQIQQRKAPGHRNDGNANNPVTSPSVPRLNEAATRTEAQDSEQQSTDRDKPAADKNGSESGLITIFTGVLAGVAVLQFIAMFLQYREMSKQARHMQSTLEETKKAADAAKTSADTATQQVVSTIILISPVVIS